MARKKKHPEHVNNERWLVSYADFITLLFAFFVVMFSVSQVDSKKMGRFTQSFTEALEWSSVQEAGGEGIMPAKIEAKKPQLQMPKNLPAELLQPGATPALQKIKEALEKQAVLVPELKGLTIVELHGEIVLRLPERLMFEVAEARLSEDGQKALIAIGDSLRGRDLRIRVEGHTDSKPISTPRFPSNWDLSTARAVAVVAFLIETAKLAPTNLSAAGYSEYHPISTNDTPEGRALNRRVDIIIVSDMVTEAEPVR